MGLPIVLEHRQIHQENRTRYPQKKTTVVIQNNGVRDGRKMTWKWNLNKIGVALLNA